MIAPEELDALWISLRVAAAGVGLVLLPATAMAWVLARGRFRGRALLETAVQLPLVLPPVVTGYLLLVGLGPRGPLGRLLQACGVSLTFHWQGAALAAAVVGFPLLVRAARLSFEAVDPRLEQVSRTLGSGPVRTFARVTLPLALPGVLAGAVLCFARALGEFGATMVFVGNIRGETRTLPLAVYTAIQSPGGEHVAARLVVLAMGLSFAAVMASELLARRSKRWMELNR